MSLLVANYGSSSEDEDSGNEEEKSASASPPLKQSTTPSVPSIPENNLAKNVITKDAKSQEVDDIDGEGVGGISDSDDSFDGQISDDDDDEATSKNDAARKRTSSVGLMADSDVVGLSGTTLNLPKPRNASSGPSSSSSPPAFDPSSTSSSSLKLGSILPTPKADLASTSAVDEELEDFVRPRDWEIKEAEKNKSMKELVGPSVDFSGISSTKKKGGKVQISIPSLRGLGDEDEEEVPDAGLRKDDKTPKAKPGSGLFALLPKPKNISETKMEKRPLIPHVLTKKPTTTTTTKPVGGGSTQSGKRAAETSTAGQQESNFFSLGDNESPPSVDVPSIPAAKRFQVSHPDPDQYPLSFNTKGKSPSPAQSHQAAVSSSSATPTSMSYAQMYNMAAMDSQDASVVASSMGGEESEKLNLAKLAGSQKVRGKELDDLDIVDVNADSALGGTSEIQENLLRELSAAGESGYRPQPKKGEGPSTVSKRKHQITYLAFQAKEREQLLKNQWASNAQTKRQTQAKYGF